MLVHFTVIKVLPEKVNEAADILAGSRLLEYFLKAHGLQHGSLSQSVDEPGKLLSLSMWESQADAQAVFADPNYGALIGELRSLLVAPPMRIAHTQLLAHAAHPLLVNDNLYLHNTIVTTAPENTQKLLSILYSDKIVAMTDAIDGFIRSYALEALEEAGRIVSMSWWRSAEEAQATFLSPEYAALVGEMRKYFIKMPERQSYQMLRIVRNDA
jgi:heme-degrading monooxygenase HmoA